MRPSLSTLFRVNAAFSVLTGLALLLFAPACAAGLGFAWPAILRGIGIALVLFAVDLVILSRHDPIPRVRSRLVVASDFLWVIGSAVLLVVWPDLLSATGRWIVFAVACVVGAFGYLQLRALLQEPAEKIGETPRLAS